MYLTLLYLVHLLLLYNESFFLCPVDYIDNKAFNRIGFRTKIRIQRQINKIRIYSLKGKYFILGGKIFFANRQLCNNIYNISPLTLTFCSLVSTLVK